MLLTKYIKEVWGKRNKAHFISRGYEFTQFGDTFDCKIEDVSHSSRHYIKYQCESESCQEIIEVMYKSYVRSRLHLCKKCSIQRVGAMLHERDKEFDKIARMRWNANKLSE